MAFEQLYKYTDKLAELYKKAEQAGKDSYPYLNALCDYHDTVLSHGKFRDQRDYNRRTIEELNPSFAKGYFKK